MTSRKLSYILAGAILALTTALSSSKAPAESTRTAKTINAHWTFNYFPAEDADSGFEDPAFDDTQWPAIALPHTWSTYETTGDVHPFIRNPSEMDDPYWWNGWGWYRKHIVISDEFSDRKVFIEFDGVQKYCKAWLNGEELGDHKGGFTSFYFDATDHVRFGEDNVLAVTVSNRRHDRYSIPPMTAGNWNLYGGIYRDVRITIKDRMHIPFQGSAEHQGGTFVTTPQVSKEKATVRIQTWVKNDYAVPKQCTLTTRIINAQGGTVASLTASQRIDPGVLFEFDQMSEPIVNLQLWSPENPYVYHVYSEIREGERLVDTYTSPLGFRWFEWNYEENYLYLNGRKIHIHGTNRHQEYPWLGDAMPKWLHIAEMKQIRFDMGNTFIRTTHYPQDPLIYDLCDRYGLIACEEVPNIKSIDFSEEVQEQNVREMIRRDRNHPSILFWSMGNETSDGGDSKWAVEEDNTRILHARKVSGGTAGDYIAHTHEQVDMENLLRVTARGWYNRDVKDLEPEYGQHCGHEEWQHKMARVEGASIRGRIDFNNCVHWLYADHGADREYKNCPLKHLNAKGALDLYRYPKYMYYLWQANYAEVPMVFIHPHFWRRQYLGQRKPIQVDSNCDQVELLVNGLSKGTLYPNAENLHSVTFENIEIEQGEITAIARKDDATVKTSVVMAGEPARIVLKSSHDTITANRAGIAVIGADIVDSNGVHVYGASNTLHWSVSGPGTLVGPPIYETDIAKSEEMDGVMYIDTPVSNLVRSTSQPGKILVKVTSPGLVTGEIAIESLAVEEDRAIGIVEPPLTDEGRTRVVKSYSLNAPVTYAREIDDIRENHFFDAKSLRGYRKQLTSFIKTLNPDINTKTIAFSALIDILVDCLDSRQGNLIADDYNFMIRQFNDCRAIARFLDTASLEPDVKKAFEQYYADEMIAGGVLKNLEAEKTLISKQANRNRAENELIVFRVSSSPHQGENIPENTLDGDFDTLWVPGGVYIHGGRGEWIEYDLGTARTVSYLRIALGETTADGELGIDVSMDGKAWKGVFEGNARGGPAGLEKYDFEDVRARYVRIKGRREGEGESRSNTLSEVRIYGTNN